MLFLMSLFALIRGTSTNSPDSDSSDVIASVYATRSVRATTINRRSILSSQPSIPLVSNSWRTVTSISHTRARVCAHNYHACSCTHRRVRIANKNSPLSSLLEITLCNFYSRPSAHFGKLSRRTAACESSSSAIRGRASSIRR